MRVLALSIDTGGAYVLGVSRGGRRGGPCIRSHLEHFNRTGSAKSRKKMDLKRGQHGRHQFTKKVHGILRIGSHGEPLEPQSVIGTFSNQCSYIVREHVPITYLDWKKVLKELKDKVWTDIKKYFQYLANQFNEDLCRGHALFIAGKALHTLQSRMNNNYVKKGKTPFEDYNFIKRHI
jgi:hypothetical protein